MILLLVSVVLVFTANGYPACENGEPWFNCFTDPCEGAECPANPEAACIPNYCGGCNAEFRDYDFNVVDCDESEPECPDGESRVNCFMNPCEGAECAADPEATCTPNYCGGCDAEFFDAAGNKVDCEVVEEVPNPETCPPGVWRFNCMFNPCEYAECAANSDGVATCFPNYCGGCNAEFWTPDLTSDKWSKFDCDRK